MKKTNCKLTVFILLVVIQLALFTAFLLYFNTIIGKVEETLKWVKLNKITSLSILFILDIITIACLLPTPILNIIVNYTSIYIYSIFPGALIGFCLSLSAVLIGFSLSFFIGKFLLKSSVENYLNNNHPNIQAIVKAADTQGLKIVFLLRLSPLPSTLVNYALSITNINIRDFVLGTFGCSMKIIVGLYAAGTLESLTDNEGESTILNIAMLIIGLASLLGVVVWIGVMAKHELENIKGNGYERIND
ncbi:hypothetical protein SteCoe_5871 [Stentor coeruleus]|uniref:VTT domain-containing protein n=1 Tax=Stentor coeruleus TaxID=5963 RepID=A0A1R2CR65_9CILI|nr:hypothetical protein SteCoe_5871 [Stentor coeruleus]